MSSNLFLLRQLASPIFAQYSRLLFSSSHVKPFKTTIAFTAENAYTLDFPENNIPIYTYVYIYIYIYMPGLKHSFYQPGTEYREGCWIELRYVQTTDIITVYIYRYRLYYHLPFAICLLYYRPFLSFLIT